MGKRRRRVLVKPNRHALIEQHQRIVGRQILRNSSKPRAGQQNDQNSDGQVQPCVTLRRKTVLQKLSLFLEPLVAHSPIQPFSLRRKRIASCCRLDRKPLTMRRARLRSRFRSPLFARTAGHSPARLEQAEETANRNEDATRSTGSVRAQRVLPFDVDQWRLPGWRNSTLPSRAASAPECQYLSVPKTRAVIERSMSVWSRGGFAFIIGTKILE